MKKEIQVVICKTCKEEFTTLKPNYKITPCKCGKINVNTTAEYARGVAEPEDFIFKTETIEID